MEKLSYTKGEAAKALGVNVDVINKLIKQGHLNSLQIGKRVLIGKQTLEDLFKKNLKLTSAYKPMSEATKEHLRRYKKSKGKSPDTNK